MFWLQLFLGVASLWGVPPRQIPPELYDEFTMQGQIPVSKWYLNHMASSSNPTIYEFASIEALKEKACAREQNYYGQTDSYLYAALDRHIDQVKDKQVAIMGSVEPWYEAVVLAYGGKPVTIEYNQIISRHPDVRTMTVAEYATNQEQFDAILSISSYEHDGLGRYGDPINPHGDLLAMERTRAMLKPGGLLFLAVPIGRDQLVWNAHRIYGACRLPLLLKGWDVIETFGFAPSDLQRNEPEQPIFVLRPNRYL